MNATQPPPATVENLRLRPGCRFVLHEFDNGPSWVLENPATGKFFRMGLREERFARRLDGSRSLQEILAAAPKTEDDGQLSAQEILTFLQTLKAAGLLDEGLEAEGGDKGPARPHFNPMYMRIPFGSPDRFFEKIAAALKHLPARTTLAVLGLIIFAGAYAVLSNLDQFHVMMGSVFATSNILAFTACFLALKIIHETAHGTVCKYFGGRVPDAGLYFVFFVPLTYIDATASWRFPSKWVRILVSSAGMLAELVVAAIAGIVWASTPVGALNTLASNLVISASVTTLLFNANPLMRFDGYFILADLTGKPNLYALATRASSSWLARVLLGIPSAQSFPTWVTVYGVACLFWRITLVLSISIGAIALLHGIGIVLALLTLSGAFLPGLRRLPKNLADMRQRGVGPSRTRLIIFGVLLLVILFVPLQPAPTTPAVIEPADMIPVRIQCPGFVKEIYVSPGEAVAAGQVLLKLENNDETARLGKLTAQARQAEAVANGLREANEEPQQMAQQLEKAAALGKQATETAAYLETLSVGAAQAGVVYGRRLDELDGMYLPTGREVMMLGSSDRREARIAISQELFERIAPKVGEKVDIFVPGRLETFPAEVTALESVATRDIRHESLTALAGGNIAVINAKKAEGNNPKRAGMELVDPHFYVTARLTAKDAASLRPGESGLARFPSAPRYTLLAAAIEQVRAFIQRAVDRSSQRTKN